MRWWFPTVPAERLAAFRILVGAFAVVYLAGRFGVLLGDAGAHAHDFRPAGPVKLLDAPLPAWAVQLGAVAALALSLAFALGAGFRWTGPACALALLWVLSYRNSWSAPLHTENLLVLHAALVGLAPAADAWSVDARRRGGAAPAPDGRYGWALRAAAMVTVLTYVIAGMAKVRIAGWDWADGEQLRNQIAYDNLRRAVMGADPSPLALPLLPYPGVFTGLAVLTLVVELGAPMVFLHRRLAALWALLAWGFHVGVLALMLISFPYPLAGLAYAPLFAVERPLGAIGRRVARWRTRRRGG